MTEDLRATWPKRAEMYWQEPVGVENLHRNSYVSISKAFDRYEREQGAMLDFGTVQYGDAFDIATGHQVFFFIVEHVQ